MDGAVDLSSEATIDGEPTRYIWFDGFPTYNEETGELEGNVLTEGADYTIDGGVTTFTCSPSDYVFCFMSNPVFPNLTLYTMGVLVSGAGVDGVAGDDADREVSVFAVDGMFIRKAKRSEATRGLTPGMYIVDGVKTIIR